MYGAFWSYAQALQADGEIWKKVVGFKKSTVPAFAAGSCDSPLCDQLLFLHEWLAKEQPGWLASQEIGKWCLDRTSGFTSIRPADPAASGGIRGVQPVLLNPKDENMLEEIRAVLQQYALQHVQALQRQTH